MQRILQLIPVKHPLLERPGSPAAVWNEMAAPWRAAAERLGFRLLDSSLSSAGPEAYTCCDILVHPDGTFLDLVGGVVERRPRPPGLHGLRLAQLRSWLDAGGRITVVFTVGRAELEPEPSGCFPALIGGLARPLLDRFLPEHLRPVPLHDPEDLAGAVERHREICARRRGRPLRPGDDPLAARERWSRR
jgi:hypothetical protein